MNLNRTARRIFYHRDTETLSKLRKSQRFSPAFTLMEIMIAIVILTVMSTLTYSSLRQLTRTKGYLDDGRDLSTVANAILIRITRELALATDTRALLSPQTTNTSTSTAGAAPQGYMQGEENSIGGHSADTIKFVALEAGQYLPDGQTHSGIVQITYRVEEDPDNHASDATYFLVRDETPHISPPARAYKRTMTFPLAKNVVGLSLSYYDAKDNKWVKKWGEDLSKKLPAMVKFSLVLKSNLGKEETFTSTVALRAS